MDLNEVKKIVREWACNKPEVIKLYLYGSRITGGFKDISDLDIAVAITLDEGSECEFAVWLGEKDTWKKELEAKLPYRVHLEYFDDYTRTVKKGIRESSILVYPETEKAKVL